MKNVKNERRIALLLVMLSVLTLLIPQPAALASQGLFGSREVPTRKPNLIPKWVDVRQRYASQFQEWERCSTEQFPDCVIDQLLETQSEGEGEESFKQLTLTNSVVNQRRYILDNVNWGVADYWATPVEFYKLNGDCEDYAISKYVLLRNMGWSDDDLRIVILMDQNLNIAHAVLRADIGNKSYILDNQISDVVEDVFIHHYKPLYSLNETNLWLHK